LDGGLLLAQHLSRKELKTDEVRETFAHGAEAVMSHQQLTLYLLIAAIVVAVGIFGWKTYAERQTVKASADFDAAMTVFHAPVGVPQTADQVTYSDENKKFTEAEQKFSDVSSKYPRTRPGELSRYYAALSAEKLHKNDDARKFLQALSSGSDEEISSMARFELADLDDRMGQGDDAVKLYQALIDKPTTIVPKPVVLLALAEHYGLKNPSEAAKLYTQIKTDYPNTPIAEQADQALALLPGKS
jgi:predicted negative regulator of RcsB-dependent stress response